MKIDIIEVFRFQVNEMTENQVINLKGRKPQRLNENEYYIGRSITMGGWKLPASQWMNPFTIKKYGSREIVLQKYEEYIRNNIALLSQLEELRGKTLACWCSPEPCHGDILVQLLSEN
jgi:hypothetical protein